LLCVLALTFATALGIDFGLLRTAVLKIAAVVIFADAALMWFHSWMISTGAVRQGFVVPFVYVAVAAEIIACASEYLFSIDAEDAVKFAIPTAIISQVSNYVMLLVLVAVLQAIVAAARAGRTPAPTAAAGPTAPTAPAAAPTPPPPPPPAPSPAAVQAATAVAPTPADREIMKDITMGMIVVEAHEWQHSRFKKDPAADEVIVRMYGAGADRVYIDRRGGDPSHPSRALVQLPITAEGQAKCAAEYQAYMNQHSLTAPPAQSGMRRYLIVPIAR
jgi:hypothetical protein